MESLVRRPAPLLNPAAVVFSYYTGMTLFLCHWSAPFTLRKRFSKILYQMLKKQ